MTRTLFKILVVFFSILGCKNYRSDNLELIKLIDKIPSENTIYEFRVDSLNRVIDTFSVRSSKLNPKGDKVFEKIIKHTSNVGKIIVNNYYRDNGNLFYSESSSEAGILSIYETWEKNGKIIKAQNINYHDESIDTIIIRYNYDYVNDSLKKMTVIADGLQDSSVTEVFYEDGNPLREYIIINNDTINQVEYEYDNDRVRLRRSIDKKKNVAIVTYYSAGKSASKEEVYDNGFLIKTTLFLEDNNGNVLVKEIK